MTEPINYMDIEEFRQLGYLQEINRMFLHPLGLALEVVTDEETGKAVGFGGVWDYRDNPEGICFGSVDIEKTNYVAEQWRQRKGAREEALGYVMQPPDGWDELEAECD